MNRAQRRARDQQWKMEERTRLQLVMHVLTNIDDQRASIVEMGGPDLLWAIIQRANTEWNLRLTAEGSAALARGDALRIVEGRVMSVDESQRHIPKHGPLRSVHELRPRIALTYKPATPEELMHLLAGPSLPNHSPNA